MVFIISHCLLLHNHLGVSNGYYGCNRLHTALHMSTIRDLFFVNLYEKILMNWPKKVYASGYPTVPNFYPLTLIF